ncbi:MAG: o-succinylbenzoate--CoA ligase [Halanaeroarchaeum sp.]
MRDWLSIRRSTTPERTALIDDRSDRQRSYEALDDAVDEMAASLAGAGVDHGSAVGILLRTREAFVTAYWAIQRLGATAVPFNVRLATDELRPQVEAIDPTVLVTGARHAETATAIAETDALVAVEETPVDEIRKMDAIEPAAPAPADRSLNDVAVVMFTSGTTGSPKPVALTDRNLLSSATASAFRLGTLPGDRWLLCLPMFHMGGLSVPIRTTLYGSTTVLHEGFEAESVLSSLDSYSATGVSLVPTMLRRLLDAGSMPSSLRFALIGGGSTPAELVDRARAASVPIFPTYGMTETASQITTATPSEVANHPETVGRPILGTQVEIVDGEGTPRPPGEAGEIVVRGYTVSPGYYGETPTNRMPEGGEWLSTGDVGYRDESGRLYVTGRATERIVTGGENVSPETVESALRDHPSVQAVAVVGLDDPEWGERVAALIETDGELTESALDAFLRGRLADYERPRTYAFVGALPRTPSGTVDREAVRRRLRDAES